MREKSLDIGTVCGWFTRRFTNVTVIFLAVSFGLPEIAYSQVLAVEPPPNIISLGGPLDTPNSPQLEAQLLQDVMDWNPRAIKYDGSYDLEWLRESILSEISSPPQWEAEDAKWENMRESVSKRAAEVAESMLRSLDTTTFELGVTTLLSILRDLEITATVHQSGWEKFADFLNPQYAKSKNLPQKTGVIVDHRLLERFLEIVNNQGDQFRILFKRTGHDKIRDMILQIARNPNADNTGDATLVRALIEEVGVREVVRDITAGRVKGADIPGFDKVDFNVKDDIPFVRLVHTASQKSINVYRKEPFMEVVTKHHDQIVGRQHYAAGPEDKWGRKLGRDNMTLIIQDGQPFATIEYPKPTAFADRMHNYFHNLRAGRITQLDLNERNQPIESVGTIGDNLRSYKNNVIKSMSGWRIAFGLASGGFQGGMTYWLTSFHHTANPFEVAMVQAAAGMLIGANLNTVQNWTSLGALGQASYHNDDWEHEPRFFKRLGRKFQSVAWSPTITSRYARSMLIGVSVATIMMLVLNRQDVHLTSIAGVMDTLVLFGTQMAWKIASNNWVSNKGKTGIEEGIRLLRARRVLADNVQVDLKLTVMGRRLQWETDLAKVYVLHQGLYNPTNHAFKIADYVTPWGYFVFTVGNALNLILERVGLRVTAHAAWKLQDPKALAYFKLSESTVLKIVSNYIARVLTGRTEVQRMLRYLSEADQGLIIAKMQALNEQTSLKEYEMKKEGEEIARQIMMLYHSARQREISENAYLRWYEDTIFKQIENFVRRTWNRESEIERQFSSLTAEDQASLRQALDEFINKPTQILREKMEGNKTIQEETFKLYHQAREKSLDGFSTGFAQRFGTAVTTAKAMIGTAARPLFPEELQDKIPTTTPSALLRSCRMIFLP